MVLGTCPNHKWNNEPMHRVEEKFSETYRNFSDVEIASLYAQIDSLTDAARAALTAEIQRRNISSAELSKLYSWELRHEAKFDRRQKEHRKKVLSYLLRGDSKWTIITILAALGVAFVAGLLSHHR